MMKHLLSAVLGGNGSSEDDVVRLAQCQPGPWFFNVYACYTALHKR